MKSCEEPGRAVEVGGEGIRGVARCGENYGGKRKSLEGVERRGEVLRYVERC